MRISACALLVTATSTILGACGSDIVAAPSPRYLPLAPSAVVAATLVTTSDIDSSDPRRFRRMDLASDHQEWGHTAQDRDLLPASARLETSSDNDLLQEQTLRDRGVGNINTDVDHKSKSDSPA